MEIVSKFVPRPYQRIMWNAIIHEGYKRGLLISSRRAGKDVLAWNIAIFTALSKKCLVFYCLPTYSQAKKCIWDAVSATSSMSFLDYIPQEAIVSMNQSDMKIKLINGSVIQLIGADSYNTSLVGTCPYLIVFSEAALCDPEAYKFAMPILAENDGKCLLVSTPRGHNFLYDLYTKNKDNPKWKVVVQTVEDTKHIPLEALEQERKQMPEELFLQEFYCSFDRGLEGSIYGRYVDKARNEGRIGEVPWDPMALVYCVFDLGVSVGNETAIIWYQYSSKSGVVKIIDCYSRNGFGLDHYAKVIKEKPWATSGIFGPHDLAVREFGADGATSRFTRAHELGLQVQIIPQAPIQDGIDLVMTTFGSFYIDQNKCAPLIEALENYHREWDPVKQIHSKAPVHDKFSNYADATRYLCQSLRFAKQGLSGTDYTNIREKNLRGNRNDFFFNNDPYRR